MKLFGAVPLTVHGVIEIVAAPVLMAAPFVLGFGPETAAASLAIGVMLMGLALSTHADRRTIPLAAHAAFDYVLGALMLLGALVGVLSGEPVATAFLAGFGAAHLALTASTRFTVRSV